MIRELFRNRLFVYILLSILGLFAVVEFGVLLWSRQHSSEASVSVNEGSLPVEAVTMTERVDPSGCTFSYPSNLLVNTFPDDTENYMHIELTDQQHPGSIVLWAKDLPAANGALEGIADWMVYQTDYQVSSTIESTLTDVPALKFLTKEPQQQIGIAAVNDGIVWIIEAKLIDEPYWTDVFNSIVSSFRFSEPTYADDGGSSFPGDDPVDPVDLGSEFEEEEVLE